MRKNGWMKVVTLFVLIFCLVIGMVLFRAYLQGRFSSVESLREYVSGFGCLAPAVLTLIQALQVVVPILPGFLGCAVGTVLFGSFGSFLCNYIGISVGSIAAFYLARHYGIKLVTTMFSKEKYEKWSGWAASSKSYVAFLFAGMCLPLFPDDFFCYFSGLTKMSSRKFIWIIILGKPWCILAYCYGFSLLA